MTAAGYALAVNHVRLALLFVLFGVFLDCLDGDLARFRSRTSISGTFLERMGHWWSNMVLVVGAGVGVRFKYGLASSIPILAALCISQAVYLAVVTDVQRLDLSNRAVTKGTRLLMRVIRANYYAMPIELPFAVALSLLGLDLRVLWATVLLLMGSAMSVFLAEFIVLLSIDEGKIQLGQGSGFPDEAVREADRLFIARSKIHSYAPVPAKIPAEVLRITGSQPAFSNDSYICEVRRQLQEDLKTLFRTSGCVFTLPCGPKFAMEAVARQVIEAGDTAVVIVGGPSGRMWSSVAHARKATVVEIPVSFGDDVDLGAVEQAILQNENVKVLFATLTELTHGVLYDLAAIGRCLEKRKIRFVVDVTGGFAVDEFRLDDWGVDLAIAGCGGGLMASVGVSVVAVSSRAAKLLKSAKTGHCPPVSDSNDENILFPEAEDITSWHIFEPLHVSTRMLLASGFDVVLAHRQEVARAFRRGCKEVLHLTIIPRHPSAGCTTAFLPSNIRADKLLHFLTERHQIGILSSVAPDGRETLCIGHSGWVFREDIYRVIEALALAIAHLTKSDERP
jgi:aspartate aminotransferase-like enzyme/phosphatidylglycerophosphate synthase